MRFYPLVEGILKWG